VGNQLAIPSQNGVGLGHRGDLGQSFAPESLADFGQYGSFRIGQPQSDWQVCAEFDFQVPSIHFGGAVPG
jgi:hypothetical protein